MAGFRVQSAHHYTMGPLGTCHIGLSPAATLAEPIAPTPACQSRHLPGHQSSRAAFLQGHWALFPHGRGSGTAFCASLADPLLKDTGWYPLRFFFLPGETC